VIGHGSDGKSEIPRTRHPVQPAVVIVGHGDKRRKVHEPRVVAAALLKPAAHIIVRQPGRRELLADHPTAHAQAASSGTVTLDGAPVMVDPENANASLDQMFQLPVHLGLGPRNVRHPDLGGRFVALCTDVQERTSGIGRGTEVDTDVGAVVKAGDSDGGGHAIEALRAVSNHVDNV
jgi:hypothetical protein